MRISDWSSDVCSSDLIGMQEADLVAAVITLAVEAQAVERPLADHLGQRVGQLHLAAGATLGIVEMMEHARLQDVARSEERRGGKECVRTCRSRWSPYH